MADELIQQLKKSLSTSDARDRKYWSQWIIEKEIPLQSLMSLLHYGDGTSQRFMWLIGDVCEMDPATVAVCMPILFSLRNEMPFPGMPRSVAKWLWLTRVPASVEKEAIAQLVSWIDDESASIACKSYTAKALFDLAIDGRVPVDCVVASLERQSAHENRAYGKRMQKILDKLR